MRYAQGGGLTAEARKRRERVRLEAVGRFEQRAATAVIAAELRVSSDAAGERNIIVSVAPCVTHATLSARISLATRLPTTPPQPCFIRRLAICRAL